MQPVLIDRGRYRKYGKLYKRGNKKLIHCGHDYDCPYESNVFAVTFGTVIYSEYNKSFQGHVVMINHQNKNENGFVAIYGHLKDVDLEVGDVVQTNQIIGRINHYKVGNDDLPHLHFAIWRDNNIPNIAWGYVDNLDNYVNPIFYLEELC